MKRIFKLTLIAIACMAVACHKNSEVTRLAPVGFTGSLTASSNAVYITPADTGTKVLTLNWPAVVYPVKAQVTYTLQADLTTDTTGSTGWANAVSIVVGNDVLTDSFTGSQLSTLAISAGVTANDTAKLVFRVKAYQDRNAFSAPVTITISPYKPVVAYSHGWPVVYMPGAYEGWTFTSVPTAAAEQANIYEGYIYEPTSETDFGFKFTSDPDWNHTNYGNGGTGILSTDGSAGNLELPGPGYYEVVANTSALTWNYTATTWGIIGDATPGGWNSDTEMAYDATKNAWVVTAAMVSSGSFKFRANNAWSIDFGIDAAGHLEYADNPAYPYNGSLNNLTVPANGTYVITLYLSDPNNYHYTAVKQ